MLLQYKCYYAEKQRQSIRTKRKFFYLIHHDATLIHKRLSALFIEEKREERTRCKKRFIIALRSFSIGLKKR